MLEEIWLTLGGLAIVLALHVAAERTGLPSAVLLVLGGLALAWAPVPTAHLEPEVILDLVIPPLLYAAALRASIFDIRANVRPVISLSVLLVAATAAGVAVALDAIVAGLGFAAAFALGAAVAPPDPVASLAIGRRAGLPRRLVSLVEGEGLLNDATALTLYALAVTAATGGGFGVPEAVGRLALAAAGGILVGVLVARVALEVRARADDALVENAISLMIPFAAFAAAEIIHGSGVLAVVVAGLAVGTFRPMVGSAESRQQTDATWRIIEYLLEGYVFLLIGQQVPDIVEALDEYATGTVLGAAGATIGAVLVVRLVWIALLRRRMATDIALDKREALALWWAGTRGVITLATALALPFDFPERDLLLFCALIVVLVTLVGQGLTFAPVLRALRLEADEDRFRERAEAQLAAVRHARERLAAEAAAGTLPEQVVAVGDRMLSAVTDRVQARLDEEDAGPDGVTREAIAHARRIMIDAQREELLRWRAAGRLSDADFRILDRRLDLQDLATPA